MVVNKFKQVQKIQTSSKNSNESSEIKQKVLIFLRKLKKKFKNFQKFKNLTKRSEIIKKFPEVKKIYPKIKNFENTRTF